MVPTVLVAQHPGALGRVQLVDKGHMQHVDTGNQPADEAGFGLVLGLGLHLHPVILGGGNHIFPEIGDALAQIAGGEPTQILVGVQCQPQKQGLTGEHVLLPGVQGEKRVPEIVEVGVEGTPLVLGPYLVPLLAQVAQKLGVVPRTAELDGVQMGYLVKVQKFVVGPDSGILRGSGHDPAHLSGNPGSTEAAQDADPLVPLLDVEIAQVFVARNGVGDAGFPQMGGAQVDPLGGKFRLGIQQRVERGSEGGDSPGGFGTDNPFGGNLYEPYVHHRVGTVFRQQLVQNRRMGGLTGGGQFPEFLLSGPQCLVVFIGCKLDIHGSLLLFRIDFLMYSIS